jgi:hypothetical protein
MSAGSPGGLGDRLGAGLGDGVGLGLGEGLGVGDGVGATGDGVTTIGVFEESHPTSQVASATATAIVRIERRALNRTDRDSDGITAWPSRRHCQTRTP